MSQSSTIFFFIGAGFLAFITMRGELPAYAKALGIGAAATSTT